MRTAYACLRDARSIANVQSSANVSEDDFLLDALIWASSRWDDLTGLSFEPTIETRYFDAQGDHVDAAMLDLHTPALEITTVTDGSDNSLTDGTDFIKWPRGKSPTRRLQMLTSSGYAWTVYDDDWMGAITVAGIWGWHSNYDTAAWVDSADTVLDAPLAAGASTITVDDSDGADAYQRTPRFSPGQLLKIEDEYLSVLAVGTDELTVLRGVNGSTAAEHAATTTIYIWEAETSVKRAILVWAAYLLARRGTYEQVSFDGLSATQFPADAPAEITKIAAQGSWLGALRAPL